MSNAEASPHVSSSTLRVRLASVSYVCDRTSLFEFKPPSGGVLPAASPGAHIDVILPNGMVRQYSLVSAEEHPQSYTIAVQRDESGRGGSVYMHERLRVGETLEVSAPRNHFPLDEAACFSVFIAGGIGITPIRSMIRRLVLRGRPWALHYAVRSREEAPFLGEFESDRRVTVGISKSETHPRIDLPTIISNSPPETHLYCCGPNGMLDEFSSLTKGLQPDFVHSEHFASVTAAAIEGGYIIELAHSRITLTVEPGKTILGTLLSNGFDVPHSCQEGLCGACETRVLNGVPDHRDAILSDAERSAGRTMMVCCSGSKTPKLVLDL